MRTLIKNGTVISAEGETRVDVLVEGEQVVALCAGGSELARSFEVGADRVLDAAAKYVIPGGVDASYPHGDALWWHNGRRHVQTGTRAAAFGGTTTIVDFAIQTRGESLQTALDAWQAKAAGVCAVDYGFHAIISDVNESSLKEMDVLVERRSDELQALHGLSRRLLRHRQGDLRGHGPGGGQRGARHGARRERHRHRRHRRLGLAKGQSEPIFHGLTRPPELEGEAVHRAIVLAQVAGRSGVHRARLVLARSCSRRRSAPPRPERLR